MVISFKNQRFRDSVTFMLGVSFGLLPAYGPFLAILFARQILPLKRIDAIWLASVVLLTIPLFIREGLLSGSFGFLQLLAPWLVYRVFAQLKSFQFLNEYERWVSLGLAVGLALFITLGWLSQVEIDFAYKTIAQAISWQALPAVFGHTVVILGGIIALSLYSSRLRLLGLALSALGVLISGSREAAIAWVILMIASLVIANHHSKSVRIAETALFLVMLGIASGLGPLMGWGQVGFLLDILPQKSSPNLIQGSEIKGDWWDSSRVSFETAEITLAEQLLTRYDVTKLGSAPWLRLQQVIKLLPGQTYTASTWLQPVDGSVPGIQGWGQLDQAHELQLVSFLEDETWNSSSKGAISIINDGIVAEEAAWTRVFVSFRYEGEQPLHLYLGLAPDNRVQTGTTAQFAGFQLELGDQVSAYTPGSSTKGLGLGTARVPYWRAAWRGGLESPILGHGTNSFPRYYRTEWPDKGKLSIVPAHIHNLYLHIFFERGLIGLLGLVVFIFALMITALHRLDAGLLLLIGCVLFMNIFDVTLFTGSVLYPLAAVAGWREASYRTRVRGPVQTNQPISRLVLFTADGLAAYIAIFISDFFAQYLGSEALTFTPVLGYALLLWPILAWREGLYPGYGFTAARELEKQVSSAAYAWLILAAGTVLFGDLAMPRITLLLLLPFTLLLLPIARLCSKSLLQIFGVWGQSVIILGATKLGRRVAASLLDNPLGGLKPVAFFDDDIAVQHESILGLPVLGYLKDAEAFAKQQQLNYAVVTLNADQRKHLPNFHANQTFHTVQYVPQLNGIPAEGVFASSLGQLLALEVRLGLHNPNNRIVKRILDITASLLLITVVSPILLAIYIWISFDSAGPAIYKSPRLGEKGREFYCLKFRTMYQDTDAKLHELLNEQPALREEYERYHKLDHDPRITKAGHILRKLSLDELPQLFNVLIGDMSLIGPRPYLVSERPDIGELARTIFSAKPGITGYWQVTGRNAFSFKERLQMEAYYVQNWSIWWDLILLFQTPVAVLRRRGAR